jgi:hypothetical protein
MLTTAECCLTLLAAAIAGIAPAPSGVAGAIARVAAPRHAAIVLAAKSLALFEAAAAEEAAAVFTFAREAALTAALPAFTSTALKMASFIVAAASAASAPIMFIAVHVSLL